MRFVFLRVTRAREFMTRLNIYYMQLHAALHMYDLRSIIIIIYIYINKYGSLGKTENCRVMYACYYDQ